jgi:hypothetical protein
MPSAGKRQRRAFEKRRRREKAIGKRTNERKGGTPGSGWGHLPFWRGQR